MLNRDLNTKLHIKSKNHIIYQKFGQTSLCNFVSFSNSFHRRNSRYWTLGGNIIKIHFHEANILKHFRCKTFFQVFYTALLLSHRRCVAATGSAAVLLAPSARRKVARWSPAPTGASEQSQYSALGLIKWPRFSFQILFFKAILGGQRSPIGFCCFATTIRSDRRESGHQHEKESWLKQAFTFLRLSVTVWLPVKCDLSFYSTLRASN